jgi:hypothetical protein
MNNLSKNNRLFSRLTFGLLLATGGLLAATAEAKVHVKIAANSLIVESFNKWTAETPWDQIKSFNNANANRPTVDLVLELQALKAGGLDFDFELVPTPNYERAKLEVVQGSAQLAAETIWDNEIAENAATLLKTDPVIRNGEFEKGIYVLPTNEKILKITSLEELRGFVGVVVSNWGLDVKALEGIKPKGIEKAPKAENVFLMIQKQRADFTLQEFSSTPDMSVENSGVKLVPVPNCKVALAGSRSWVVSKAAPKEIFDALQKGVAALRNEGRFTQAFKDCGFFHPKTLDWKRLY